MYSQGQRKRAIETFIKFDHSYADTVAELGYPTRACLRNWWNEYKKTGEVPESKLATDPRYTAEMKQRAVEHYLEHGKSLVRTMRALGYPKSREVLGDWIDEIAPGQGAADSNREEGAGGGGAGGEDWARRGDSRASRRVADRTLPLAQGDDGR